MKARQAQNPMDPVRIKKVMLIMDMYAKYSTEGTKPTMRSFVMKYQME